MANEYKLLLDKTMEFYQTVFALSPVKPTIIIVAPDEASYAQVLQRELVMMPEQAIRTAKSSSGLSAGSKPIVVINVQGTRASVYDRIGVLTHEMFHQMQRQLIGSQMITPHFQSPTAIAPHEWLVEGSARMAENLIHQWMGEGSLVTLRHNLINTLAYAKLKADPLQLQDHTAWQSLVEQRLYPYETATLMTDYLMQKTGNQAVLNYFALLGTTANRDTAFQLAFGVKQTQFIADFKDYLARETANVGRIRIEVEGAVNPEISQEIEKSTATTYTMLKNQGWTISSSLRFILVPDEQVMLSVLARRQPLIAPEVRENNAKRLNPMSIGGTSLVYNVGKTTDANARFNQLAPIICLAAQTMTAYPAPVSKIVWIYDGGLRVMAAKASEAAGYKSFDALRRNGWKPSGKLRRSPPWRT